MKAMLTHQTPVDHNISMTNLCVLFLSLFFFSFTGKLKYLSILKVDQNRLVVLTSAIGRYVCVQGRKVYSLTKKIYCIFLNNLIVIVKAIVIATQVWHLRYTSAGYLDTVYSVISLQYEVERMHYRVHNFTNKHFASWFRTCTCVL